MFSLIYLINFFNLFLNLFMQEKFSSLKKKKKFSSLDIFFWLSQIFSTEVMQKWNDVCKRPTPIGGNSVGVECI